MTRFWLTVKPQKDEPERPCPAGKVLTIGIGGDLAVLFGGSAEGGIAINLSTGDLALYGSAGKTYGVDVSVGVTVGLYKGFSALQGRYTEIEAGILALSGSGVFNDKKEFVGGSATLGPGLPASGRATQGNGGIIGGGCGKK